MAALTEDEILAVLRAIERREVTFPASEIEAAGDWFSGDFTFHASNGWELTVFDDCDEWDYLDSVRAPDGREVDFDQIWNHMPRVRDFQPNADTVKAIWGLSA